MFNIALNHVNFALFRMLEIVFYGNVQCLYILIKIAQWQVFLFFKTLNLGDVYTLRWIGSSLHFSEWLGGLTPGHSLGYQHATEEICQLNQCTIFISSKIHCIKDSWMYMENLLCIFVLFFCKYYAFDSSSIWQNGGNFADVKSKYYFINLIYFL